MTGRVNKGGRPPHQPAESERRQVESMAGYGIPLDDIARVLKISVPTLAKHYRHELDTGHIKANSMVAQSLFTKATGTGPGAVIAAIFWLKVRAGWREYPPNEEYVETRLGKKEAAILAAQNPDTGSALGELMMRRQDHLN